MVIREDITQESNFRATNHFQVWLQENKLVGICGVDTRQITHLLREKGSINAAIVHKKNGVFNLKNISKKRVIIFTSTKNTKYELLKSLGCEIILLKKMNIDPALAGSVVLTTVTDIVGIFAFLGTATWLLI